MNSEHPATELVHRYHHYDPDKLELLMEYMQEGALSKHAGDLRAVSLFGPPPIVRSMPLTCIVPIDFSFLWGRPISSSRQDAKVHCAGRFATRNAWGLQILRTAGSLSCSFAAHVLLILQILLGVQFLHSAGIVHNDLKLDNVLLNQNQNAKLGDFGLATRIKHGHSARPGTPL